MGKLIETVEKGIDLAIESFRDNHDKFENEQQFQELLYCILANELHESNMLFGECKNGKKLILLVREKITTERYRKTGSRDTRGRLDFAILDSQGLEKIQWPETGAGLQGIPIAVGIEIKLNKTDKTWKDELNYLKKKLKSEVPKKDGRYIIFLSTRKTFQYESEYKEWIKNHPDVKIRSNKRELGNYGLS